MLAGLILLLLGTALDQYTRAAVARDHYEEVRRAASTWTSEYRIGHLPSTIPTEQSRVDIGQVVDASGKVVAASVVMKGKPPLLAYRPPSDDRIKDLFQCGTPYGCLIISAIRAEATPDSAVTYAAIVAPPILTGHQLEYILLLAGIPLLGLIAWTAWMLVGRTLRPVKEISARMAEVTASDLGLRVPVPPAGQGELVELAHTANDTLSRLEKSVEEQRRFVSDVSHELRNPISGLSLQLEDALLDREHADPWPVIESALVQAERLSAIVGDLLAIARAQADSKLEPIDLGDFVIANALQHPKIKVQTEHGLLVRGSRVRIARILSNLLNNAVRHAASKVEVVVRREGGNALLSVTDDGAGVPEAYREKIFERFVRLEDSKKRDPAGSGLGLAISREIAQDLGGSLVLAERTPHGGACFELRLPLLASGATAPDEPLR